MIPAVVVPSLGLSISTLDVARFTFKSLRYEESVSVPLSSYFSRQWKQAYKSFHNYAPLTMTGMKADMEFIYMGVDVNS